MNHLLDLFQELDYKKIEYVVWKNCNLIDKFLDGRENLDIYINEKNKEKFKLFIKEKLWIEVKSTTINHKNINHYLFITDKKIYHIHIYFRLITGNSISKNYDLTELYNYFENKIFDNKNNLWIMNYDLQLELFKIRLACKQQSWLGSFLINRDLNNYIDELKLLIKNADGKKKFYFSKIKINLIKINFCNNNNSKNILAHISNYKRFNDYVSMLIESKFLFKVFIKNFFGYKKFRLKKEIYIFISGADSSGKTTIIEDFEKLFSKYFKTKKYNIGKPFPKFVEQFFLKKKISKKSTSSSLTNKNPGILKILNNINLGLLRFLYSLNIFYFHNNTNIFLLDRYVSEFTGHINGPRLQKNNNLNTLNFFLFKTENYFYKLIKPINVEFRLITDVNTCLKRNKKRLKLAKETDDEIIIRHKIFSNSRFKSKKIIELNNDLNKLDSINNIIKIIVKDLNENN